MDEFEALKHALCDPNLLNFWAYRGISSTSLYMMHTYPMELQITHQTIILYPNLPEFNISIPMLFCFPELGSVMCTILTKQKMWSSVHMENNQLCMRDFAQNGVLSSVATALEKCLDAAHT